MEMNLLADPEQSPQTFAEIVSSTLYRTPAAPLTAPDKSDKDITFFVACYNEEENIIPSLDVVVAAMAELGTLSWEIIVIDDASKDKSVQLVKQYIIDHPDYPLILVVREENEGVAQNFIEAAFIGRGKYYKFVCGDNVETSAQLASILRHIGEADMLLPFHAVLPARSLFRRVLSRLFTIMVNVIGGYNIRYYNGCGVFTRYNVMRWNTNYHGFGFQADLITRLLDQGKSFVEIPVVGGERPFGTSKALTLRNLFSVLHFLLDIGIRRVGRCFSKSARIQE